MADLMSLAGNLAGSATPWGALIGGVFGFGKKFLDNRHEQKQAEMALKERALDRRHDLDLADKEIEKETAMAQLQMDEAMFTTDSRALSAVSASQDAEISAMESVLQGAGGFLRGFAGLVMVGVTAVQKLTRPGLTAALFGLTCYFYYEVNRHVGGLGIMDKDGLIAIHTRIILSGLSMTELAIAFWFVARPGKK